MTYDETVSGLRAAIIASLKKSLPLIQEIGKHPRGVSRIDGIAVCLLPFEDFFALYFRTDKDAKKNDFGDWLQPPQAIDSPILATVTEEYNNHEDGEQYMLKLNTAIADALLCEEVVEIVKGYGMAEYFKLDQLGGNPFDFVVLDMDECIRANFCDVIRWKRNIDTEILP